MALNKNGFIVIIDDEGRELERYATVIGAQVSIDDGDEVKAGEVFVEWDPYSVPIISEHNGVVEFNEKRQVISLEEKPEIPRSHYAVTGVYFYDGQVCAFAAELQPSDRGELEITDLNQVYLDAGNLSVEVLGRGTAWLDTGSHDNLASATDFVRVIEKRQGLKISCPEEIAWRQGWINDRQLFEIAGKLNKSGYGNYLIDLIKFKKS